MEPDPAVRGPPAAAPVPTAGNGGGPPATPGPPKTPKWVWALLVGAAILVAGFVFMHLTGFSPRH